MKEKFLRLKTFDWKLFVSLCLLSLVPAVIQTIETFIISSSVSTSEIDVIGQIEWFDLIDETIQAFLVIPLYFILNSIIKNNKDKFGSSVFKTGLITFVLYTLFSVVVLLYGSHLVQFMNPDTVDIGAVNRYLSVSTIAFMVGIIVSFINVVFVVIDKAKNVYIFLGIKTIVTIISDFIIIPKLGVDGVAISNIMINLLLAIAGVIILLKEKALKVEWFNKEDIKLFKDWGRIGLFSGLQQFINNWIYAIMVCKMVNMVAEQGNYWVANNFIWGWLLIPGYALTEVIRKDCKDGYNNLIQSNYYFIVSSVVILWCISIPLWIPFFKNIEVLENYKKIFNIVIKLFPFYIFYIIQIIPDNIFIGLGKTYYNVINSIIVNFVYYGIWFILYKTNSITFTMNTIIMMFGFGMIVSIIIAFVEEKIFLKKELTKLEIAK